MTSLAERAHAALAYLLLAPTLSPYGPYLGEDHARTAVRLAATLGLELDQIATIPDTLRRRSLPGQSVKAEVTCPVTGEIYTFLARNPLYSDESFELLGPCPECGGQVPLADIRHLADLGDYLNRAPLTTHDTDTPDTLPYAFPTDPGHTDRCRFGDML